MILFAVNVALNRRLRCPSRHSFFGLTPEYMEGVYETFFAMKYFGGWSFYEAYNLPVGLRTWFIKRLASQIGSENEAQRKAVNKAKSRSR